MFACPKSHIPIVWVLVFLGVLRYYRCVHSQSSEIHAVAAALTHPQMNVFDFFKRLYKNFQPCLRAVAV